MARPRVVPWFRLHPQLTDAVVALVLLLGGLGAHFFSRESDVRDPSVLGVVLVVLATVPLIWRRRWPIVVLTVLLGSVVWLELIHAGNPGWLPVLIGSYSLTAHRTGQPLRREGAIFWGVVVIIATLGTIFGDTPHQALLSGAVLIALAMVVGDNVRRRRARAAELAEREENEQREHELLARQQLQDERQRIARELHDVVAHSVSVMIIQAAAARRQLASNPDRARDALTTIEETGREAMTEMRRMLGVLRNETASAELAPQPSLASLAELVEASTDVPVTLRVEGDVHGLPSGIELNAYRLVQEALTNVRRHAGRVDRVELSVIRSDDSLSVEVSDDGRGSAAVASSGGSGGLGLVGMRERVSMFGGELVAGPQPGGGWRVRAVFPLAPVHA